MEHFALETNLRDNVELLGFLVFSNSSGDIESASLSIQLACWPYTSQANETRLSYFIEFLEENDFVDELTVSVLPLGQGFLITVNVEQDQVDRLLDLTDNDIAAFLQEEIAYYLRG